MQKKLKIILITVICTTVGWAAVIEAFLFWPRAGGPALLVEYPPPGEPNSLKWQSQKGQYLIQLVSSNQATASTAILFTRTSQAPERIWFQTSVLSYDN